MKTLKILGFVQTAILLLLFGKIIQLGKGEIEAVPAGQNTFGSAPFDASTTLGNATPTYYLDENQLRKIIREELRAQLEALPESNQYIDATVASNSINENEMEDRREQVFRQLEYYSSVGSISDLEMQQLQADVAKLDAASQKEALSQLTRAINSGRLNGRL